MTCVTNPARRAHSVYNTTIKSIVPLPDPTAPQNSPAHPNLYEDQPRGAQVLAIYPDTTSFYRATVLMPPIPGTGNGIGVKEQGLLGAKKGKYVLQFEDDDEKSKEVDAGLVVEVRVRIMAIGGP
jgi:SAGA-associated factor 29